MRAASPSHRRWTNRSVARELDHRGRRWLWSTVLGVVISSIPLAFWQLQQNECLRLTLEANELRAKQERLGEEARRLSARCEALQSLSSIEPWAARSGLVHPSLEQIVVVSDTPPVRGEWLALNAQRAAPNPIEREE